MFYPYIDPVTGLPIIDPNIMASLDPNSPQNVHRQTKVIPGPASGVDFSKLSININQSLIGAGSNSNEIDNSGYEKGKESEDFEKYIGIKT